MPCPPYVLGTTSADSNKLNTPVGQASVQIIVTRRRAVIMLSDSYQRSIAVYFTRLATLSHHSTTACHPTPLPLPAPLDLYRLLSRLCLSKNGRVFVCPPLSTFWPPEAPANEPEGPARMVPARGDAGGGVNPPPRPPAPPPPPPPSPPLPPRSTFCPSPSGKAAGGNDSQPMEVHKHAVRQSVRQSQGTNGGGISASFTVVCAWGAPSSALETVLCGRGDKSQPLELVGR